MQVSPREATTAFETAIFLRTLRELPRFLNSVAIPGTFKDDQDGGSAVTALDSFSNRCDIYKVS